MGPGLEEVWRDLSVFTNLSSGTFEEAGELSDETPVTWVMLTENLLSAMKQALDAR